MSDTYTKFRNEVLAGGTDRPEGDTTPSRGDALIFFVLIVALLVWMLLASRWMFVFVVGLLISILLHELGHFVTARWTGMKATQFFLFMGPKLWSFRRGETEYGVRALPVGAYVRIIGMNGMDEVPPEDEPRAYRSKSYPRRLLVITAGSIMHILIAIGLLFGVYAVNGRRVETDRVGIAAVVEGQPAALAGVKPNDKIVSIDGVAPNGADTFVDLIRRHQPGDTVTLVVDRDGRQITTDVTLGTNPNADAPGSAYLGVSSGNLFGWNQESVFTAAKDSITDLGPAMWQSVGGVLKVLNPANIISHVVGTNKDPSTQPTTVVGISRFSDSFGRSAGFGGVLLMLAGVNVFVGLFNLFPLLPFDGGHAAIATYERLRSRRGRPAYRADVSKMIPVAMTMIALLAMLFLAGLYLDVVRPVR